MVYTVERVDSPIKTSSRGVLEFGRPENGLCWAIDGEGTGMYISLELFAMVQGQTSMIIGLESMGGEMVKYKVNGKALENLLHKFSQKVDSLARANRWAELNVPESNFLQLQRLVEAPFVSGHCLISGLEPHRTPKGPEHQRQSAVEDICRVVIGEGMTQMTTEDARVLANGTAEPLKMRNLGWERLKFDRTSYIVSLEVEATIGLGSPIRTHDRVLMGPNPTPNTKKGDYAIRQFLREKEASSLANARGENRDIGVVLLRGLTRIAEVDDAILRRTREYYRGRSA
jgi:hypothetical protein